MSLAACFLFYSAAVLLVGPPVLRRLTRHDHAPRCGVAAWLITIASVLLTWLTAAVLVVIDEFAHGRREHSIINACIELLCQLLAGRPGSGWQLLIHVGALGAIGSLITFGIRVVRTIRRLSANARSHAEGVRLVGHPIAQGHAFVVDADQRAAYCVSGNPSTIVVTSAAVAALDASQLQAVLAHERAHVRGHHLELTLVLRALAVVFPRLALMRDGLSEVTRLLEVCADESAARIHGRQALLKGLLALVSAAAPAGALGAASIAVLSRAQRLVLPPARHIQIGTQAALASIALFIALVPVTVLTLASSGMLACQ